MLTYLLTYLESVVPCCCCFITHMPTKRHGKLFYTIAPACHDHALCKSFLFDGRSMKAETIFKVFFLNFNLIFLN